jgi:hypothetical protein
LIAGNDHITILGIANSEGHMSKESETSSARETKKEPLSAEFREEIREFVWRTLTIPAALLFVISGIGGYALKAVTDEQSGKAYHEAYKEAGKDIVRLATEVSVSKGRMDISVQETGDLLNKVKGFKDELSRNQALLKAGEQVEDITRGLLNNRAFVDVVTKSVTAIKVSEPFHFAEGPASPTPIPNLSTWRFCALTRAATRADLGGVCAIVHQDGRWLYYAGRPQQQICSVTCWDF